VQQRKQISAEEARQKIWKYCAYQERCHQEVKTKLYEYGLHKGDVDEIISDLITQGFLNEERFAKAFAGGKFRMKQWGRVKITHELEARGLTPNCIRAGLKEIDEEEYVRTLEELVERKSSSLDEPDSFVLRDKVSRFLIQKGFEAHMVWRVLKEKIR
jgi:regulatory protein